MAGAIRHTVHAQRKANKWEKEDKKKEEMCPREGLRYKVIVNYTVKVERARRWMPANILHLLVEKNDFCHHAQIV